MVFTVRSPFVKKPEVKDASSRAPTAMTVKAKARRGAMLTAARDVLTAMPEPGEAIHFLQTGYFDLVMLIPLLLEHYGAADHVRITTLSYNGRNLSELCRVVDSGSAKRLSLVTSTFFRNQEGSLYRETCQELRSRGHVVAVAKNHAKVILLDIPGAKMSIEGSANLRSNRSLEQVALIRDDGLHDWHSTWIDSLIANHEGDGGKQSDAASANEA